MTVPETETVDAPVAFSAMTASEMFPTVLWIVDLAPESEKRVNTRIIAELDRMTGPRVPREVGQTFQTDQSLHREPAFAPLRDTALKAGRAALDQLEIDYGGIDITAMWANINPTGAKHSAHSHPNNFLSGVYYVRTAPGADSITFFDPRPQAEVMLPRARRMNRYNGNSFDVEAKPGRLILFNAWLKHEVPINRSDGERISVSFNLMFPAFSETMARPLWKGTV